MAAMTAMSLQALSGVFFGLTVGLLITYGLTFVIDTLAAAFLSSRFAENGDLRAVLDVKRRGLPIPTTAS